jgi:hypothetical protein
MRAYRAVRAASTSTVDCQRPAKVAACRVSLAAGLIPTKHTYNTRLLRYFRAFQTSESQNIGSDPATLSLLTAPLFCRVLIPQRFLLVLWFDQLLLHYSWSLYLEKCSGGIHFGGIARPELTYLCICDL